MASLFLSHSSKDNRWAEALWKVLGEHGFDQRFLDFHPEDGIPVGRDWERELYLELNAADAIVFLSSAASRDSPWCAVELAFGRAQGKKIFPLQLDGDKPHQMLTDTQAIPWPEIDEAPTERLVSGLRLEGLDPGDSLRWDPSRDPYPGLRAFEEEDAGVFFGRAEELRRLMGRLDHSLAPDRFLVLIGSSGSGKSSLIRAGLVPRLKRTGRWLVMAPLSPHEKPFEQLARKMALEFRSLGEKKSWKSCVERLNRVEDLVEMARDLTDLAGPDVESLLVFVDQAEELVTRATSADRQEFLDLLGEATGVTSPVTVVLALRSEFLTRTLDSTSLRGLFQSPMILEPLDSGNLSRVIVEPARKAGLSFESGLAERMVEDTGSGEALPHLAFTLRELYARLGTDRLITHEMYESPEIGGVIGALRRAADRTLDRLSQKVTSDEAIRVLLRLVTLDAQDEPTRQRIARRNLDALENEVVQAFIDARLLVSKGKGKRAIVGVAHEALLLAWSPLADAIAASRGDLQFRRVLERAAREWDASDRKPSYLWAGERLTAATAWLEANPALADELPQVSAFLDEASISQLDYLARLPEWPIELPSSPGDVQEGAYNEMAAESLGFLLLDKRLIRYGNSRVELCDILTPDGDFVHVTRKLASSKLSAVFSKATNVARLLVNDPGFREEAHRLLGVAAEERFATLLEPDDFTPSKFQVVFVMIANWEGRSLLEALPANAQLTLQQNAQELERLGYRVSYRRIEIS